MKYDLTISPARAAWYRAMIHGPVFACFMVTMVIFFIPWDGLVGAIVCIGAALVGGVIVSLFTNCIWSWLALRRGWVRKKS